jgi:Family of unknown function (DUF5681)
MSLRPPKLRLPAASKASAVEPSGDQSANVGYGHPPIKSRFKSGQSGNPRGRPKGARNKMPAFNEERLKDIIIAEAYRTIKVNDGPRQVSVPMAQAIVRSVAVNAVKGQHRSQRLFSEMLSATERDHKVLHDEMVSTALEYKWTWEKELEHHRNLGLPAPDPVPHPDHIELDMRTGQIVIDGPMTLKQRDKGRQLITRFADIQEELAWLKKERSTTTDEKMHAIYDADIAYETRLYNMLSDYIHETPWMGREWAAAVKAAATKPERPNQLLKSPDQRAKIRTLRGLDGCDKLTGKK